MPASESPTYVKVETIYQDPFYHKDSDPQANYEQSWTGRQQIRVLDKVPKNTVAENYLYTV